MKVRRFGTVLLEVVQKRTVRPFFLICGNNVIEHRDKTLRTARYIREIAEQLKIPCIFKSSFDKANRTSHLSFRGIGLDAGVEILKTVKEDTNLPVLTDVHETVGGSFD